MNFKLLALGLLSVSVLCIAQTPAHAFYPRHHWLARHYCIQPQYNAFTPCCSCDPCGGRCWTQFGFTHGHGGHGHHHGEYCDYLCKWNTLYRHQWPKHPLWCHLHGMWKGHGKSECADAPYCDEMSCPASSAIVPSAPGAPVPSAPAVPPLKLAPPAQTSLPPSLYGIHSAAYTPYYYAAPQPMAYPMPYMTPAAYYPMYGPVGYYPLPYGPMMPMALPGYGY